MTTITAAYKNHAQSFSRKIAIHTNNSSITYQEWNELCEKTAAWLHSQKLENKTIGIFMPNGIPFLQLFAGAAMAGWTALPLDTKWQGTDLEKRLKLANPAIIVASNALCSKVNYSNIRIWEDCLKEITSIDTAQIPAIKDNPPFYMGFTSGTTGDPKAFVRSHESWAASFICSRCDFHIDNADNILIPGALVHSHFLYGAISTLALGGTVYLLEKFSPSQVIEFIQTQKLATVYVVPTMVEALLKMKQKIERPCKFISSGAKWSEKSKQTFREMLPKLEMYEFYGASELSFVSVLSDHDSKHKAHSVGRPCTGAEIQIRQGTKVITSPYETGKIYVRSKLMFTGYLDANSQTIQSIQDEDGWATINDMGYVDEDGFLYIAGRENNMILYGALNIFPEEIEKVISTHPDVEETAVIGLTDPYWGQLVTAVVKGKTNKLELKRLCKRHLSAYKIPRKWFFIDEFPYTTSGKIARPQVKELIERKVAHDEKSSHCKS